MTKFKNTKTETAIKGIVPFETESMTQKLRKITETNQPIKEEMPTIYTEKKDGVMPAYDIRSDRFEIAREALEKIGSVEASDIAKSGEANVMETVESKKMKE